MKTYWRLLSFARPLRKFVIPFICTSLLASIFGILNFTLLIPLLKVLFKQGEPAAFVSEVPPTPRLSVDYFIEFFNFHFDKILTQQGEWGALKFVCAIIIASVLLSNVFRYLTARQIERFKVNMVGKLRQAVFDNAIQLHLGFFSSERKGNLISRVVTDVQEVENSVANSFSAAFKELFTLVSFLYVLFKISVTLSLFSFLVIPISGAFIAVIVRKMRKEARDGQNRLSGLISLMDEVFGGMRVVKGFNAEGYIRKKFQLENQGYQQSIKSMAYKREMSAPFSEFMGVTVVALILLFGGQMVLSGESDLSAEEFITYIAIFSQVMRPAKEIANAFSNTQRGIAAGERVLQLLDAENVIKEKSNALHIDKFEKSIDVKKVSFSYDDNTRVLHDIDFRLERGKTIALVGSSGGGKSTIADLIPRFYDPTEGQITIDGLDLRDLSVASLRQLMGIVTQESILFNDTIFNNIAFGTQATEKEVRQAAEIANAHLFISQQPQGYQTVIGERGTKLSGGQRQRISIARAILKNPPLLILDEATSALDTESEKLVQDALTRLMANRTVLVIAHRLSTIQHADEILVIDRGRIIERGTHAELLENPDGFYRKLTLLQGL
ncbi:MAG: ABC transporter ATP-binding protein [Spirosomataceae bacterium]